MSELDPVDEIYLFGSSADGDGTRETDPKEVSLFIGGKEFVLEGVGDETGPSLAKSLRTARQELLDEIAHPESSGLLHDMTEAEAASFLRARLEVLERLIAGVPH